VHPHPGARYVAVSSSPDEVIQLVEGAIDVDVQPLRPGERFRVLVGDAELEVRGTTFTVTASEQHLVDVAVQHGRVDLRPRAGSAATLTAGQSWHAAKPTALVEASLPQARPASPARSGSASPRSAVASAPASAQSRAAAAAASVASSPQSAASSLPGSPARLSAPLASSGDTERAADATGASVERSYDQAWAALRANDFDRAAGGFARVVLLAPDGPLVEDASFWRAVALARGQRGAEARSAFRDFLDGFRSSPHAGEASAMLGWLLIDARSYDEAAQRFSVAARDTNPAVRRSARAGLDALARREP
jgi:TolA-binding protein